MLEVIDSNSHTSSSSFSIFFLRAASTTTIIIFLYLSSFPSDIFLRWMEKCASLGEGNDIDAQMSIFSTYISIYIHDVEHLNQLGEGKREYETA